MDQAAAFAPAPLVVGPVADGGFLSEQLGLRLVPTDQPIRTETRRFIRWFTPEGQLLPTGEELAARETARADALAQRLREIGIDP